MNYERTMEKLKAWAANDERVRALIMTGSGATASTHPLSDRDIEVVSSAVEALLEDESWWSDIGEVLVVERLEDADEHPTRLVYYVGGKIDFTLLTTAQLENRTYGRPFTVLVNKDAVNLTQGSLEFKRPDTAEFEKSTHWAYAAALMCAKALVREELWSAKLRDNDLKEQLLEMIEWDHRARYGNQYDTRYLGSRMNQWMDEDLRQELSSCWGQFDARDSARALRHTLLLYRRVNERASSVYAISPRIDQDRTSKEIERILASGNL